MFGNLASIQLLADAGASATARTDAGQTAVEVAAAAGNREAMQLLLRLAREEVRGKARRSARSKQAAPGPAKASAAASAAGELIATQLGSAVSVKVQQVTAVTNRKQVELEDFQQLWKAASAAAQPHGSKGTAYSRPGKDGLPSAPPATDSLLEALGASRAAGSSMAAAGDAAGDGRSFAVPAVPLGGSQEQQRSAAAGAAGQQAAAPAGGGSAMQAAAALECRVCLEQAETLLALFPCGHRATCAACTHTMLAAQPRLCPICRQQVRPC